MTYPPGPNDPYRQQPRFMPGAPPPPFQPPPPPRRKRHWVRNGLLGLSTLIVIIIVVSAAANSGESSGTPAAVSSAAPSATSSAPPAAAAAKAAALGTPVQDGKFQFTVTAVSQAKSVGDTADGMGDTAQGEYTILHVTVTNISSAPQTLDNSAQYVYDAGGRKYDVSSSADLDLNSATGSDSVFLNGINRGSSLQGQLAFDMPTGTKAVKAELHDSSFSNGITVSLP